MKINISEKAIGTITNLLDDYLNRHLDPDVEDIELIIEASKALGELQGAIKAVKDLKMREGWNG